MKLQTQPSFLDGRRPNIAICYFGITRCPAKTSPSLENNIIDPLRDIANIRRFAHLYDIDRVTNLRNREDSEVSRDGWKSLSPDVIEQEKPEDCPLLSIFDNVKSYGDAFENDFSSTRNLLLQLHSLSRSFELSLSEEHDAWIFLRPDLLYHDNFARTVREALLKRPPSVAIPNWQHWYGGLNDRFSICVGRGAADAYAHRAVDIMQYCETRGALHAEKLLRFRLERLGVPVDLINLRASRVRAGGEVFAEDFRNAWIAETHRKLVTGSVSIFRHMGLWGIIRPAARRLLKRTPSSN